MLVGFYASQSPLLTFEIHGLFGIRGDNHGTEVCQAVMGLDRTEVPLYPFRILSTSRFLDTSFSESLHDCCRTPLCLTITNNKIDRLDYAWAKWHLNRLA